MEKLQTLLLSVLSYQTATLDIQDEAVQRGAPLKEVAQSYASTGKAEL
jgi:hypothetical protein